MNRSITIHVLPATPAEINIGDVVAVDTARGYFDHFRVESITRSVVRTVTREGVTLHSETFSLTNGADYGTAEYIGATFDCDDTVWLVACAN